MVRAIAKEAEAERHRRAKVISAKGEAQAAANILEAAEVLHKSPEAMHIRHLKAMLDMASDKTSTVLLTGINVRSWLRCQSFLQIF